MLNNTRRKHRGDKVAATSRTTSGVDQRRPAPLWVWNTIKAGLPYDQQLYKAPTDKQIAEWTLREKQDESALGKSNRDSVKGWAARRLAKPTRYPPSDAPAKPAVLSFKRDNIPHELRRLNQWAGSDFYFQDGNWTKIPTQTNGRWASSVDPTTWCSFDAAVAIYEQRLAACVSFLVSQDDLYNLGDLDDCFNRDTGQVEPWAAEIVHTAQDEGAYVELSPGGNGFHIIGRGEKNFSGKNKNRAELYCHSKALALTGWVLQPINPARKLGKLKVTIQLISARIGIKSPAAENVSAPDTGPPVVGVRPYAAHMTDDDILKMACADTRKNGPLLKRLLEGDVSDYQEVMGNGKIEGPSRAELACASLLAYEFWLDADAVERVMMNSALYRPKWDSKRGEGTYLQQTIAKALQGKTEHRGQARIYTPNPANYRKLAGIVWTAP